MAERLSLERLADELDALSPDGGKAYALYLDGDAVEVVADIDGLVQIGALVP